MKAAVYHAPGVIEVEEVEQPEVGPRDVLLRVSTVGICGSDLHVYRKGQYGAQRGRIMGHEFCGQAVEVGAEVQGVALGGRWTGYSVSYCGTCYWCRRGQVRLCPELFDNYSGFGKPGAMAEYVLIEDAKPGENLLASPRPAQRRGRGDGRAAGHRAVRTPAREAAGRRHRRRDRRGHDREPDRPGAQGAPRRPRHRDRGLRRARRAGTQQSAPMSYSTPAGRICSRPCVRRRARAATHSGSAAWPTS